MEALCADPRSPEGQTYSPKVPQLVRDRDRDSQGSDGEGSKSCSSLEGTWPAPPIQGTGPRAIGESHGVRREGLRPGRTRHSEAVLLPPLS